MKSALVVFSSPRGTDLVLLVWDTRSIRQAQSVSQPGQYEGSAGFCTRRSEQFAVGSRDWFTRDNSSCKVVLACICGSTRTWALLCVGGSGATRCGERGRGGRSESTVGEAQPLYRSAEGLYNTGPCTGRCTREGQRHACRSTERASRLAGFLLMTVGLRLEFTPAPMAE